MLVQISLVIGILHPKILFQHQQNQFLNYKQNQYDAKFNGIPYNLKSLWYICNLHFCENSLNFSAVRIALILINSC